MNRPYFWRKQYCDWSTLYLLPRVEASQERAARETQLFFSFFFFVSQAERQHAKRTWESGRDITSLARPFLFESWEASPRRGVLDYRKLTSGASREIAFQWLLPRGGVPAGGGQGGSARGSSGEALRRAGRRTAERGEGREAGGACAGAEGRGGGSLAAREPHGAQVALSRSGELLPRLPLAAARGAGRGDAARSSSGSRAARHFR